MECISGAVGGVTDSIRYADLNERIAFRIPSEKPTSHSRSLEGVGTALLLRSLVGCMKWHEDADGRAVLLRFVIALDADPPPVPLDELLCDK